MAAAVVRRRRGRSSSQACGAQRGRLGNKDGRFEANDLAFERNTGSATNGLELMDGGDDSPRGCRGRGNKILPCTDLEREEHVRDERLVLDLCGNIAILTVLSDGSFANPISDDCSRQKETDENAAWRCPMKNEFKHYEKVFRSGLCVEPCCEWCGLRA